MTLALEVSGLCKSFGGLPVTNQVSLAIEPGERRLIIGPNGAGKTTLFNLIAGDLTADSGSIKLFGQEIVHLRADQRSQRGMSRTFQIITLFPKDTLSHNVVLSLLGHSKARWNAIKPQSARHDLYEQANKILSQIGLGHLADRPLSQVSYGEKRRVEIAMALAQKPRLLLLDEPLAGLSMEERKTVQTLLADIPRDITMIMIEHDMDTSLALAEKITLLHYGNVIVEGTRAEVVANPRTQEIYLGH